MSVELLNVGHAYTAKPVLTNITLRLEPGTMTALQGPSGSGKTTLLAIIGGLIRPRFGTVIGLPAEPGQVQWIHQTVNLMSRRSSIDNVAVALYPTGVTRAEALDRARTSLAVVGLADYAHRRVNTLSGGEAQRVSIARALTARPALVLGDEPTGQLDQVATATVLDALLALPRQRSIVVIATHDPSVAARCDRQFAVANGNVREIR